MALKLNERYPGRFDNPTAAYPQGSFKNRSAPGAQDGSYLEKDWANDSLGFFGRLLTVAGMIPNGTVDTALSSQYYDAFKTILDIGPAGYSDLVSKVNNQTQTYTVTTGSSPVLIARSRFVDSNGNYINIIEQTFRVTVAAGLSSQVFNFPVAFPNACLDAKSQNLAVAAAQGTDFIAFSPTAVTLTAVSSNSPTHTAFVRAIGY